MNHYEYCDVIRNKINVLSEEIKVFKSRLKEYDTGHIHTAINVMEHRINELTDEFNEAQRQRNR